MEKFQFSMYDNCGEIENLSENVSDVEKVAIYAKFIPFYAFFVAKSVIHTVSSRNFMWRKIEPKSTFVEKNDKYQVCVQRILGYYFRNVIFIDLTKN